MSAYTVAHSLFGYYRARFTAKTPEKILNSTLRFNIPIHSIRRTDEKTVEFCFTKRHLKAVRGLINTLEESDSSACSTVTFHGLPVFLNKYSRRYGLMAGTVFALLLLGVLSNFIWAVKISGNAALTGSRIRESLAKVGLREGAYFGDLDLYEMQLDFLLENPDISFVSINMHGTTAYVQVRERELEMQSEDTTGVYNLVADYPGKIVRYAISAGDSVVKIGEPVFKGQLLVTGLTENSLGIFSAVRAAGKVYAETEHEFSYTVALESAAREYTGRETVKKSIIFMGKEIKLFLNSGISYDLYDTITLYEDATVFGNVELPFRVKKYVSYEYTEEKKTISPERAEDLCYDEYKNWLTYTLADSEIKNEDVSITHTDEGVTINACVTCVENIAVSKKVGVEDFPENEGVTGEQSDNIQAD
ncbi:MAG: sporulation protein YqfD [Firmicutes bacterium]|nr:sporulation protein YqfD [Bacillota bacterium]